jgi:hypothetical protein
MLELGIPFISSDCAETAAINVVEIRDPAENAGSGNFLHAVPQKDCVCGSLKRGPDEVLVRRRAD